MCIRDRHTEFATVYAPSHYAYRQTRTVPGDHDPVTHVVARAENVPVDGIPHNADSLLGYIRNWKPEVGTTGYMFVVVGRYPWSLEMTFVGPETLTTTRGEEKALRIDATAQKLVADGQGFQPSSLTPKRSFTMWIRVTCPKGSKRARSSASVVWKLIFPTNKFFMVLSPDRYFSGPEAALVLP